MIGKIALRARLRSPRRGRGAREPCGSKAALGIGVETVKAHVHAILRKLGLPNRAAAARWYADSVNTGEA